MINRKSLKNSTHRKLNLISSNDSDKEKSYNSFKDNKINNSNITFDKDKDKKKLIKELKEKNNLDYYIYNIIKNIERKKRKEFLSEYEISNLSYKDALKIEDRDNSIYYFALLKMKNKIISTFLNNDDYNIKSIKISSFILQFVLSLTVNALFYNDEVIHEINQQEEDNSLISKYSRIIYSAIISGFINYIIEFFAFSQKKIIELNLITKIKQNLK